MMPPAGEAEFVDVAADTSVDVVLGDGRDALEDGEGAVQQQQYAREDDAAGHPATRAVRRPRGPAPCVGLPGEGAACWLGERSPFCCPPYGPAPHRHSGGADRSLRACGHPAPAAIRVRRTGEPARPHRAARSPERKRARAALPRLAFTEAHMRTRATDRRTRRARDDSARADERGAGPGRAVTAAHPAQPRLSAAVAAVRTAGRSHRAGLLLLRRSPARVPALGVDIAARGRRGTTPRPGGGRCPRWCSPG